MHFLKLFHTMKLFSSTAKHYPIYCFQWHPEKILYVWNPVLAVDHSPDSIRVAQYIANFFGVEARKNSHRFRSREAEESKVIYPHKPIYIGNITESPYEQIYTFKNANATEFGVDLPEHFWWNSGKAVQRNAIFSVIWWQGCSKMVDIAADARSFKDGRKWKLKMVGWGRN